MLSLVSWVQMYAQNKFALLANDEAEGQGLVEYALIIVLIAIVCIGALTLLGTTISGVFDQITGGLGG